MFQLLVVAMLLAWATSIYLNGLGYVTLHALAMAGIGAYVFAVLCAKGWHPILAACLALMASTGTGLVCAEAIRPLRGDGLTLATFGIGVFVFELFRILPVTNGVYGISGIPAIGTGFAWVGTATIAVLASGMALVWGWKTSKACVLLAGLRCDEWAALSVGVRIRLHQLCSGVLAGLLAGAAGILLASASGFIEPRMFQPLLLLIPLAASILAGGRVVFGVMLAAALMVGTQQSIRFVGGSPVFAGPVSEILIACLVGIALITMRTRGRF